MNTPTVNGSPAPETAPGDVPAPAPTGAGTAVRARRPARIEPQMTAALIVCAFAVIAVAAVSGPLRIVAALVALASLAILPVQLAARSRREDAAHSDALERLHHSVDERERNATRLRQSEAHHAALLNAIPDTMFMFDRDGVFVDFRASVQRDLSFPPDMFLGKSIRTVVPQLAHTMMPAIQKALDDGVVVCFEYSMVAGGMPKDFEARVAACGDDRVICIVRNITEDKRARDEVKQARDAADEANAAKSTFLTNISHEIRVPMNGVLGMTEVLLETDLDDEQKRYVWTVRESAESLLTIINDIIDFSKIEAGKLSLERVAFAPADVISRVAGQFGPRMKENRNTLEIEMDDDVPEQIVADPVRLRQIITNYLSNAAKFTNGGTVTLGLSLRRDDGPHDGVLRIEVADTGIGISEDRRRTIFRRFTHIDAVGSRRFSGSGLGLAITRELCLLMGGRCGVRSIVGEGSTFWAEIPVGVVEERESVTTFDHERPAELEGLKVLVLDEVEVSRPHLTPTIASQGAEVSVYASAVAFLGEVEDFTPFDVVVVGDQASGPGGAVSPLDIVSPLRMHIGEDAVFVRVAGGGLRGDAKKAARVGYAAYLTRPLSDNDLLQAIRVAVGKAMSGGGSLVTRFTIAETTDHRATVSARVLVVDDNQINRLVAGKLVGLHGCAVDLAVDGRQAVEMVSAASNDGNDYDLIFMDVAMPVMDGFAATRRIRELRPDVPIVALTANARQEDREKCRESGMNDFLPKPATRQSVGSILARWVREDATLRSATPAAVETNGSAATEPQREAAASVVPD